MISDTEVIKYSVGEWVRKNYGYAGIEAADSLRVSVPLKERHGSLLRVAEVSFPDGRFVRLDLGRDGRVVGVA